jgi:hypothetical protein
MQFIEHFECPLISLLGPLNCLSFSELFALLFSRVGQVAFSGRNRCDAA